MKFFILSPITVPLNPHLFPTMYNTFEGQGHEFVKDVSQADIVLFDLHSRIGHYDHRDINYVAENNVPVATFDEWDRGGMSSDIWPAPLADQQLNLWRHIKPRAIHFCRLFNLTHEVPKNLFPYEKPILYEEGLLTPEQLFDRPLDVCLIANTSPARESIRRGIEADGRLKCLFRVGQTKIPFNDWLNQHRMAKLYISASGGGFSNERPQHLFSIAGLIQEDTDQLLLHPFTSEINCIKISPNPTKEELDLIFAVVNDEECLHRIYKSGYDFMKTYYSKEYIASYILGKIKEHLG